MNKKILAAIFTVSAALTNMSLAHADESLSPLPKISDEWRFEVTPYLWSPGMKGTFNIGDSSAKSVYLSSSNVLGDLKSGGMIAAEAHYGNWGIFGDVVSATLQNNSTTPIYGGEAQVATKATVQQTVLTGAATYTLVNNKEAYIDGLLGVRAIDITATFNDRLVNYPISKNFVSKTSTVDPIIGGKGRYRIADSSWYIPVYADIGSGGGTSNLTWQAAAGIGKTFSQLVDASLSYRALYYDMKSTGVLQKTTMQGLQLAVSFKF